MEENCPCTRCRGDKKFLPRTVKTHIKSYGLFSPQFGKTIGEFVAEPLDEPLNGEFWTVAR